MSLIVEISQGKLKGKDNKSVLTGKPFYSFQGIPYAKSPVGELRFQAPQPYEKWEGTYDATYERNSCTQIDFFAALALTGNEDCLFLNVSTPQLPSNITIPKAVMVFIHGGGFFTGSGSEKTHSPDYLMERDIITVTINYRLHALGLLNLGLRECPGNAGLKDQLLALKWVKDNIANFGGDPENITIFGESAGASSVHYHTISPLSKGIFQKAILQSGSAYAPWALTRNPEEIAFALGKKLGFDGNDNEELLNFLKRQDAADLAKKSLELQEELQSSYASKFSTMAFAPSVEVIESGAFLPELPEKLMKIADPLPVIFGANDKEGMVVFKVLDEKFLKLLPNDLGNILNRNFEIDSNLLPDISRKVKQRYFADKEIGIGTEEELSNLFTDIFCYRFYEAIDNVIQSSLPAYVYEFTYDGGLNLIKNLYGEKKGTQIKGACHGDELGYLFYPKQLPEFPPIEGDDLKVINILTTLWTNFAKFGNPSNEFYWKPSTLTEPSYLRIDADVKLVEGKVYGERLQFLKSLLDPVTRSN